MKPLMWKTTAVLAAAAIVLILFYRRTGSGLLLSLAITAGTVLYHFAMRLVVGGIFNRYMKNRADYTKPWYQPKSWETSLYRFLRVKKWKNRMPTYDPQLFDPKIHTWEEIIQAMCQAELVHETIAVLSFMPILAGIRFGAYIVFIITSVLSALLDLSFAVMQRYNRPRVLPIMERNIRAGCKCR